MTDKQKFEELMQAFDIQLNTEVAGDSTELVISGRTNEKVGGYPGFLCGFYFNSDGAFERISIYE